MRLGYFRLRFLLLLGLIGLFPGFSLGEPDLQQDFQNWDVITLTLPVTPGKKLLWYGEAQPRIGNIDNRGTKDDFTQILLRTAVGYQVTRNLSVWQGYAWTPIFEPRNINENRIFQQLTYNRKFKQWEIGNRTRLEQRWIENTDGQTSVRLRHLIKGVYPIRKSKKWFVSVYDEAFVNLNSVRNGPAAGFDQNRLFAGIQKRWGPSINAELGYLNQYVNSVSLLPDRMNHAIVLMVNFQPGSQ